jgi:hypothetical protein
VSRWALPFWFALESVLGTIKVLSDTDHYLFTDARLYLAATRAWLDGGNPWDVGVAGNFFAAPPPSLVPLVPLAVLPPDLGVAILVLLGVLGAVATIRLLRLPWWWLLFPPLVQSVLAGNVQSLLVPLIVVGGGALAVFLKVYSAVPMAIAGHWRGLATAVGLLVITAPLLPWPAFLADLAVISERIETQSTSTLPLGLAPVLLRDLRDGDAEQRRGRHRRAAGAWRRARRALRPGGTRLATWRAPEPASSRGRVAARPGASSRSVAAPTGPSGPVTARTGLLQSAP